MAAWVDIVQNTVDGLMIGSSYALLALGFTLIFGVMRRLNLAYGPAIMLGVTAGAFLHARYGAPVWVVVLASVAAAVIVGLYVERLCFAALGPRAATASMVSSFAIWMQLEEAATFLLPRHTNAYPALIDAAPLTVGPLFARVEHLAMAAVAIIVAIALHFGLYRTRAGLALRASIDHPVSARLVGIDLRSVSLAAFALASLIGGMTGVLIAAAETQVTPMLGMWATMKGLVAMMLGGLGSLRGALAGGLLLGMVEAHGQWYFGPEIRELLAYLLLFGVIVIRPGGLFGART
ncbi:MAG: branched-chain amino acid ABC transporter permease [Burkholderiaceae bacterium]